MSVSYKKLFKLLVDKEMKKKDLKKKAEIQNNTMTRLANNENIIVVITTKICSAQDCKMDDIIEVIPEGETFTNNVEKGEQPWRLQQIMNPNIRESEK